MNAAGYLIEYSKGKSGYPHSPVWKGNYLNQLLFAANYIPFFFLGSTERQILNAFEDIVEKSSPLPKLAAHFQDVKAAKLCILNKISFCEAQQKVLLTGFACTLEVFK